MFIDSVIIQVRGGNGGNGAATLLRDGQTSKGGPDGGNGGNGGSVYAQGSTNINDLSVFRYKKKVSAEDGVAGAKKKMHGRNAIHTTILVPLGTSITDTKTNKMWQIHHTEPVLLASGGKGGRGNVEFKSPTNRTPRYAEVGELGESKRLHLDLRIIADIGLIGLPNAGKSSLLSVLTNATPKIANYPFTTLEPNIGAMGPHLVADIPGLIEGASTGKGLGIKFLKHIEKTKILVHCIDSTASDLDATYEVVRNEFKQFNETLLTKPEIIVLCKADLSDAKELKKQVSHFKKRAKVVLSCSVYDPVSIEALKKELIKAIG